MTAITVKMRTVKTKTEKQTLLISLIRFWAMGSVVRSDSFMGFSAEKNPMRKNQIQQICEKRVDLTNGLVNFSSLLLSSKLSFFFRSILL